MENEKWNNFYTASKDIEVCYNCFHSKSISQICLTCHNSKAWEKPASVEPIGNCKYFEKRK